MNKGQSTQGIRPGGGHVDLVTGEPGVGKSRLIREPGYLPDSVSRTFRCWCVWSFCLRRTRCRAARGSPESASQYYMFQSLCELVAYASAQAPIAIVIEDLHWGDDGTYAFFRFLASGMPNLRLHLIATYRNTDIGRDAPFASVVGHLHSSPYVTAIRLWGITGEDINALLTELEVRGDIGALADEISNRTGGNTLFVRALIAELGDSPLPQSIAALPEGIRHLVGLSTARLSKEEYEIVCHTAQHSRTN